MTRLICATIVAILGSALPGSHDTLTVYTWNVFIGGQYTHPSGGGETYARGQMNYVANLSPRPDVVVLQEVEAFAAIYHALANR